MTREWSIERMYHTVINATDLDRTVAFYEALGFAVLNDRRNVKWPDFVATIFGLKRAQGRGVLTRLPPHPPYFTWGVWVHPQKKVPPHKKGLHPPASPKIKSLAPNNKKENQTEAESWVEK